MNVLNTTVPAWSTVVQIPATSREEADAKIGEIHDQMLAEGEHVRITPLDLECHEPGCDGFHGQYGYLAEYYEEDQ